MICDWQWAYISNNFTAITSLALNNLQYCVVSTVCSCCFEAVHYTQTIRWAQTCWICINLKIVAHNITTVVDWAPQYLSSHGELEVLKTV